MIGVDVIRDVWRKRYKAALNFIDLNEIETPRGVIKTNIHVASQALSFYCDFLEELINSGYNLYPPIVSMTQNAEIEMVFKKDLLKQNKTPKLTVLFSWDDKNNMLIMSYKSSYTDPILKGKVKNRENYEKELKGLVNLCLLNLSI